MNNMLPKLTGKFMRPLVQAARKAAIYTDSGRSVLVANAHAYGYEVNEDGVIVTKDGRPLSTEHEDYQSIIMRAQKVAAVTPMGFGDELLGD
tara:strand:- start:835 stop:1110 length:276 start_codon:yes stop_codon:yes gene_type:complete